MADRNNISSYTAKDIEKYHRGQLSARERHELEKAALDDPFLADALEGYMVPGVNTDADLSELRRRLEEKTEEKGKIIPLSSPGKSFPWWRAAAIVIFILGAGLLSKIFLFDNRRTEVAEDRPGQSTTVTTPPVAARKDSQPGSTQAPSAPAATAPATDSFTKAPVTARPPAKSDNPANWSITNETVADTKTVDAIKEQKQSAEPATRDDVANVTEYRAEKEYTTERKAAVTANTNAAKKTQPGYTKDAFGRELSANAGSRNTIHAFRGRVTDANNNALPFVNITNVRDQVGTYTDAKGNFVLISPDSTMDVQVRSLGYENSRLLLNSHVNTNQVIMQEDRNITAQVLDTVKRNYAARSRAGEPTFEEPEPADGWSSYDTYLSNNIKLPENLDKQEKAPGDVVELSFEITRDGEPVNIRVEKSLCEKCDQEAIRLVKEGPKWKRKSKKGKRTTVKIPFVRPN